MTKKTRVFISYAREDEAAAQLLSAELNSSGIQTWFDKDDLEPGVLWEDAIREAIRKCDYFLALISNRSLNKVGFVQAELKYALEILDEFSYSSVFIIPVRLEECSPTHPKLVKLHQVDLFPEWAKGIDKIVSSIRPESSDGPLSINAVLGTAPPPIFIACGRFGLYDTITCSSVFNCLNISNSPVTISKMLCEWHIPNGRLITETENDVTLSTSNDIGLLVEGGGELLLVPFNIPANMERFINITCHFIWLDKEGRRLGFEDKDVANTALPQIFGSLSGGQKLEEYKMTFGIHFVNNEYQRIPVNIPYMGFVGTPLSLSALKEAAKYVKEESKKGTNKLKSLLRKWKPK